MKQLTRKTKGIITIAASLGLSLYSTYQNTGTMFKNGDNSGACPITLMHQGMQIEIKDNSSFLPGTKEELRK